MVLGARFVTGFEQLSRQPCMKQRAFGRVTLSIGDRDRRPEQRDGSGRISLVGSGFGGPRQQAPSIVDLQDLRAAIHQVEGGAIVTKGFAVRMQLLRALGGSNECQHGIRGQLQGVWTIKAAQVHAIPDCRCQVVGIDLGVFLEPIGGDVLQPACEALVEVGSLALCQGLVGGVADEYVAEPEGVVAVETGIVRSDDLTRRGS